MQLLLCLCLQTSAGRHSKVQAASTISTQEAGADRAYRLWISSEVFLLNARLRNHMLLTL